MTDLYRLGVQALYASITRDHACRECVDGSPAPQPASLEEYARYFAASSPSSSLLPFFRTVALPEVLARRFKQEPTD